MTTPEKILDQLRNQSKYLVVAESLTGGLLTASFAAIAGASDVLLTGIIAYDTRLKHELLGVSNQLLENQGPVDPEVAAQMAEGLRSRIASKTGIDSDQIVGISTTGVAGPSVGGAIHCGVSGRDYQGLCPPACWGAGPNPEFCGFAGSGTLVG